MTSQIDDAAVHEISLICDVAPKQAWCWQKKKTALLLDCWKYRKIIVGGTRRSQLLLHIF